MREGGILRGIGTEGILLVGLLSNLERFLAYALVLLGQWSALGLVLAAKSIARFRELENQDFADYYLIGTLSSLSVAVATGVIVGLLIH